MTTEIPVVKVLQPTEPLPRTSTSTSTFVYVKWKLSNKFFVTKVEVFPKFILRPFDILAVNDGNELWISEYSMNQLSKFDLANETCSTYRFDDKLLGVIGIAINPIDTDAVYVSCQNNDALFRLDTRTNTYELIMAPHLLSPRGLSFTSTGNLIWTSGNSKSAQIYKFKRNSVDIESADKLSFSKSNELSDIWTAKVNPRNDSELFVSYSQSHSLVKVVNGTITQQWSTAPKANGGHQILGSLNGMCFYENHLFVVDRLYGVIRVVDLATGEMDTLDFVKESMYGITVDPKRKLFYVSAGCSIYKLHFVDNISTSKLFTTYPPVFPSDVIVEVQ